MAKQGRKRTLVSFDWALKRLLRQKANHDILEGFLSELLQMDVEVKNLLESESNKEAQDDKSNCVDLLCENQNGELLLIELQYLQEIDYFQRMLFGASKLIAEYLNAGDAYEQVRKVYSINILYFDLGQGKDYLYHGRTSFRGVHLNDELQLNRNQKDRFEKALPSELYPEYFILKINTFDSVAKSSLDEWIYYLKTGELPEAYHAKGLKEVEEKLKFDKMDASSKKQYNKFMKNSLLTRSQYETALMEGMYKGMDKGKEEGIAQGRAEERRERNRQFVLSSFKKGHSKELIAEIVDIPIEEVEQILKEG